MDAHNRAIALGRLVIFVDNQLDPRGLASPARVSTRVCKSRSMFTYAST